MTTPIPADKEQDAPAIFGAGVSAIVTEARRLGLIWNITLATVNDATAPTVICDGDTEPISVTSMIDYVVNGQRVYVIQVPPGGNFIVGSVPIRSVARGVIDYVANISNLAPYTAETTIVTSNVVTFTSGRAYSLCTRLPFQSAGAANYQHLLYRRNTIAGAIFAQAIMPINTNVRVDTYHEHVVRNSTSSDIVTAVAVTAQGAAAVTALGNVQYPRSLGIYDIGAAVDFPNAVAI